jgi:hypothetical protein
MRTRLLAVSLLTTSLLAACDRHAARREVVATPATADVMAAESATTAPPPQPSAAPGPGGQRRSAFSRHPPSSNSSNADAIDECTQVGGIYFSCRSAYFEEKDPVVKRYLRRIAEGQAAGVSSYAHQGPRVDPGSLPHAEVPGMCDPKKPCRAKSESGELNAAVSCLARAFAESGMNDPAGAKAAHALACKCDPKDGSFPGYNGTAFLCDAAGKPAFIAPKMKVDEGKDIVDCAICEPERGPSACQREIERLRTVDPELATYVETRQVPRCQTPNEGPHNWGDWSFSKSSPG